MQTGAAKNGTTAAQSKIVAKEPQFDSIARVKADGPKICRPRTTYFPSAEKIFAGSELTHGFYAVIIVGFAHESGDFCLTEAVRVVCAVDDGPKTDWLSGCLE